MQKIGQGGIVQEIREFSESKEGEVGKSFPSGNLWE
jgi:hypothetical protein